MKITPSPEKNSSVLWGPCAPTGFQKQVSGTLVQHQTADFVAGTRNARCSGLIRRGCEVFLWDSSFAPVSEACAFHEFCLTKLREQDETAPETWAAMSQGKKRKLDKLAADFVIFNSLSSACPSPVIAPNLRTCSIRPKIKTHYDMLSSPGGTKRTLRRLSSSSPHPTLCSCRKDPPAKGPLSWGAGTAAGTHEQCGQLPGSLQMI